MAASAVTPAGGAVVVALDDGGALVVGAAVDVTLLDEVVGPVEGTACLAVAGSPRRHPHRGDRDAGNRRDHDHRDGGQELMAPGPGEHPRRAPMSLRAGTRRGSAHGRSCLAIQPIGRGGSPILRRSGGAPRGREWRWPCWAARHRIGGAGGRWGWKVQMSDRGLGELSGWSLAWSDESTRSFVVSSRLRDTSARLITKDRMGFVLRPGPGANPAAVGAWDLARLLDARPGHGPGRLATVRRDRRHGELRQGPRPWSTGPYHMTRYC